MKITEIFNSKYERLKKAWFNALDQKDAAEIGRILEAGFEPWGDLYKTTLEQGTPDIIKVLIDKKRQDRRNDIFCDLIEYKKFDTVDTLLEDGVGFDTDYGGYKPLYSQIFSCSVSREKKLKWLEAGLRKNGEKSCCEKDFLHSAVKNNLPEAVDLAVKYLEASPRVNDETCLRDAAAIANQDMCLFLIEKHGADIERAKWAAKLYNEQHVFLFLQSLEPLLPTAVADKKPATLETLSEEVTALRETVTALTHIVEGTHVTRLEKPVLTSPKNPAP